MAIPVAVEQVIKGYLNARRGMSLARVVEGTGRRSTWEVHALTQLGEAGPPKTGRATSPRRSAPAKRTAIRKKRSKK